MKRFVTFILMGVVLIFAACKENPAQEYGRGLIKSYDKAEALAEQQNLDAIRRSVQSHHALNGSYPESIDEIVSTMGLNPADYDYDPDSGEVSLK